MIFSIALDSTKAAMLCRFCGPYELMNDHGPLLSSLQMRKLDGILRRLINPLEWHFEAKSYAGLVIIYTFYFIGC